MKQLTRLFVVILSIATGALFLYSAYTKTEPIQSFEYTMVEFAHLPWLLAALAARFFIGLEAGLGALIILHLFGKRKWVLKAAFGLVFLFSFYLIYLWISAGDNINCGCFGDAIWMSPSSSLIKNAIILIVLGLLIRYHKGFNRRWANIVAPILLIAIIIVPFCLFALPDQKPNWLKKDHYKIDLASLYMAEKTDKPTIDLNKGKYIIAFFSLKCPHCKIAAYKMHLMKEKDPSLPFFMVLGGDEAHLKPFWDETKSQNIPHTLVDKNTFLRLAGPSFPVIDWVNDGWVEAQTTYVSMDQKEVERWVKQN